MKYYSTRHHPTAKASLSFRDVLFSPGYAADGGLFVPEEIPRLKDEDLMGWKDFSYKEIVAKILRLYVSPSELNDDDIKNLISSSYQDFELPNELIHFEKLEHNFSIAELFRGPTLAFKDLSLSILSKLLEFFLKKEKEQRLTIIVATSGDTGPAAAHSVSNLERLDLVLLYPLNRVSNIQELQILSMDAPNIHVCAGEGTSDDLDAPVKELFLDADYSAKNNIGTLNSFQWGRILLQAAHYIYVYFKSCTTVGQPVTIIVPTGAAGNLAAGVLSQKMGFPIKLISTVTENDILARTYQHGDFSSDEVVAATLAPAMDIQAPYNIERIFYFVSGGDSSAVAQIMEEFEKCGRTSLPLDMLKALRNAISETISVSDEQIKSAIGRCFRQFNYAVCPHTATAVSYYFGRTASSAKDEEVCVGLATASPAKFPDAIHSVDTTICATHPRLEQLKTRYRKDPRPPKYFLRRGQDWTTQLKQIIANI